jgi:Na+-driven multidrug efflux pump
MYDVIFLLIVLVFGLFWTFAPEHALEIGARNNNQLRKLDHNSKETIKIIMRFFGIVILMCFVYLIYLYIKGGFKL